MSDIISFKRPLSVTELDRRRLTLYKWEAPVVNGFIDMDGAVYFYKPVLSQ